jgi:type II secretory pathway pseudopilin PulG
MNRHLCISTKRPEAFTLLELSVAAALIAALLVTTIQMLHALDEFRNSSRRRIYAGQAVAVVSEQVANMSWGELTTEAAQKVTIPDKLRPYVADGKLVVEVAEETNPTAKRITSTMSWEERKGRKTAPIRLTTWVFPNENSRP